MCVSFSYMCLNKLIDFLWWAFHIPTMPHQKPLERILLTQKYMLSNCFSCVSVNHSSRAIGARTGLGFWSLAELPPVLSHWHCIKWVGSYVEKLADATARGIYNISPFYSHAMNSSSVFRKKRGTVNTLSVLVFIASLCGEKLSIKYSCERIYCFITSLIKIVRSRQHAFCTYHAWLFQTNLVSHNWHRYRIHWFGLVLVVVLQCMSQDRIMCMAWNVDGLWCGVDEKKCTSCTSTNLPTQQVWGMFLVNDTFMSCQRYDETTVIKEMLKQLELCTATVWVSKKSCC